MQQQLRQFNSEYKRAGDVRAFAVAYEEVIRGAVCVQLDRMLPSVLSSSEFIGAFIGDAKASVYIIY